MQETLETSQAKIEEYKNKMEEMRKVNYFAMKNSKFRIIFNQNCVCKANRLIVHQTRGSKSARSTSYSRVETRSTAGRDPKRAFTSRGTREAVEADQRQQSGNYFDRKKVILNVQTNSKTIK